MRLLAYMPQDTIAQALARQFADDGHEVETTHTFSVFLRRAAWADWTILNATKFDSPKYLWKILASALWARLRGRRLAIFMTIDLLDLTDRPFLRPVVWAINFLTLHAARVVILLAGRQHIVRRYRLPERKALLVYNCPDRRLFHPLEHRHDPRRPLTFLYHGELLWWHGLERFLPVLDAIRRRRPARLVVCGRFYPTVFRLLGVAAGRREVEVKRQLAALLERPDVEYRGRVPLEILQHLMAEADFHISLLNNDDEQARTELRTGLLEAMLAGMACLHAPTPGLVPGLFRDGENILLIDPRDPVAAADKILALADAPDRLDALRREAVRTVEEHFRLEDQYRKVHDGLVHKVH